MSDLLMWGIFFFALVVSFLAGLTYRAARERRVSAVIDLAFQEIARREKETRERVRDLERMLKLSTDQ